MDYSAELDAAVAEVFGSLQGILREDLAAKAMGSIETPAVVVDGPFAFLNSADKPNTLEWALGLRRDDPRLSNLAGPAKRFAELANVPPYETRPHDGWEVVVGIGIALQAFDFVTNAQFGLPAIQLRVREGLLRDHMIERTIWGVFGLKVEAATPIGDRCWLLPATIERRSHVAKRDQLTYPLIQSHAYLVSDRIASAEDLRSAKRDELPRRLLSALRVTARSDLLAMGPWFETTIMLPSRFAGFTTHAVAPELPRSFAYPADDVPFTVAMATEGASLDRLLNSEPPKLLKTYVRSLHLAVGRLSMATSRNALPDALLDLMIGLESLLSKLGEKTEITYRIARRGAHACSADSAEKRAAIRDMISDAYNLRSEVVHGAKRDPEISAAVVNVLREFVATLCRLSAFSLGDGMPLIDQLENALLGDRCALETTLRNLRTDA